MGRFYPRHSKMYQLGRSYSLCMGLLPSVPSRLTNAPQHNTGEEPDEDGDGERNERAEQVRLDRHQKDDSQADSRQQQGRGPEDLIIELREQLHSHGTTKFLTHSPVKPL